MTNWQLYLVSQLFFNICVSLTIFGLWRYCKELKTKVQQLTEGTPTVSAFNSAVTRLDTQDSNIQHDLKFQSNKNIDLCDALQFQVLKLDLLIDELGYELIEHPAVPERTVIHPAKPATWSLEKKK